MQRYHFLHSRHGSAHGDSGVLLGLALTSVALVFTFWPGLGSSPWISHRTAKSVNWYSGHLDEAMNVSHACLTSEDAVPPSRRADCRNALRAINVGAAPVR